MVLTFWWLALALIPVLAVGIWLLSRPRGHERYGRVPVAHIRRLTALPAFARGRSRLLIGALAVFLVTLLPILSALVGIARPATVQTITPDQHRRDVVLCLDASGSMTSFDADIVDAYIDMLDSFQGERIGMTVFNATAVTVFPLTDDYEMVREFLEEARLGFESWGARGLSFTAGTVDPTGTGSSLIGDGLASCISSFDKREDTERSRSIIFATDNELAGVPIYQLDEATELAVERDVRVYTLAPPFSFSGSGPLDELKATANRTGGEHYSMRGGQSAVDGIVRSIQEQEAKLTDATPVVLVHDQPRVPLVLTLLGVVAAFVLAWRFRL
ncbi:vWA domain-containing protein [Brevibacterium otitidis]|uniref:VWA domain-containing protein n=1 Tax=Brevibacterium otitidis TaxID=53364 RepID=A0ABV5X2R6_9MICO|nr:VWA domain-containing protein [Brevibacterium otitidis]